MTHNDTELDKPRGTDYKPGDKDTQTVDIDNENGYQTISDADSLDLFKFERGDKTVRWDWIEDEPENGEIWVVAGRYWQYRVSWIPERDNVPNRDEHRRYTLINRNLTEIERTEAELTRGHWKRVERGDDDD